MRVAVRRDLRIALGGALFGVAFAWPLFIVFVPGRPVPVDKLVWVTIAVAACVFSLWQWVRVRRALRRTAAATASAMRDRSDYVDHVVAALTDAEIERRLQDTVDGSSEGL